MYRRKKRSRPYEREIPHSIYRKRENYFTVFISLGLNIFSWLLLLNTGGLLVLGQLMGPQMVDHDKHPVCPIISYKFSSLLFVLGLVCAFFALLWDYWVHFKWLRRIESDCIDYQKYKVNKGLLYERYGRKSYKFICPIILESASFLLFLFGFLSIYLGFFFPNFFKFLCDFLPSWLK